MKLGYIKKTNEEFIEELFLINDKITPLDEYAGCLTKIRCKCKICNHIWSVTPNNLLRGHGCPICWDNNRSIKFRKSHEKFMEELSLISDTIEILGRYNGEHDKIKCKCKKCECIWDSTPNRLLRQNGGCPHCNFSKGENKIRSILERLGINYIEQHRFAECKNKRPLPFDFYLPEYNACIEYQGGQHFFAVDYFGGEDKLLYQQKNDSIKKNFCENNKINLVIIPYWDEDNAENILHKRVLCC